MNAVYAGSFDPFTNGHMDIVRKASKMFDKVFIVISHNYNKTRHYDVMYSKTAIQQALIDERLLNVSVFYWDKVVVDFCREFNAQVLIRGLRSPGDYAYEENVAAVNKELAPEIETIYLRADTSVISSSMVRELLSYGRPVDKYVPKAIMTMISHSLESQKG